jgi:ATP-dependent protease ClpP protease subunit
MGFSPKKFYQGTLTNSAADLYTVPVATSAVLKEITLVNYTAGAVTATLHLVPSGGSVADGNKIFDAVSLNAHETKTFPLSQGMSTGDKLSGLASAGTAINIFMSGFEIV